MCLILSCISLRFDVPVDRYIVSNVSSQYLIKLIFLDSALAILTLFVCTDCSIFPSSIENTEVKNGIPTSSEY